MPNLGSILSKVSREYRRFSYSFPISKRTGESMGLQGFIGRAAAVGLGYGYLGPHCNADRALEDAEDLKRYE